jgi:PmbA protein
MMDQRKKFEEISDKIISRMPRHGHIGGLQYEIYYQEKEQLTIVAEGGAVEDFLFSSPFGVGFRVICDGGMGYSFSTHPDDDAIEQMVADAITSARNTTPDEYYAFAASYECPYTGDGLFDDSIRKIPTAEKIERAKQVESGALAVDPRVRRVRSAQYGEVTAFFALKNSNGVDESYRKSSVFAQAVAMAEEGDQREMGWDGDFSLQYDGLDPALVGRRAGEMAVSMLGGKKAPTGRFTALLTPQVAVELLEVLSQSLLGENVIKGKSMLDGKEGRKIFSPEIHIIDDGLLPGGLGTAPVDGEGIPHRWVELVREGVLLGFLYDVVHARRRGCESTGSSVRDGVMAPPASGICNLFIERGKETPDALLAKAGKGIIITELLGIHTANPITGEFSVGASGFVFEEGMRKHPITGAAVAGDLIALFSRVVAVGSDLRFFGNVGSPSLLISEIEMSGA